METGRDDSTVGLNHHTIGLGAIRPEVGHQCAVGAKISVQSAVAVESCQSKVGVVT